MALPTRGRVIIETTVGEIDIELWSREAPKACRNFIALAMEGYYDGVMFHRVVPDFLVQTGDRTGTGAGGESFFGEPFEDEIHPRLRFVHRGLVGCANNGSKNSNDSQFFITLDRADELNGKHTLWGRCVGDTIFNVLKIGASELDANEKPLYPPKIKRVRIIDNPFDDIVPRITAEEKRVQQRAKEEAQREREERERRKGAKKDNKLLSFGAEEEQGEEEPLVIKKKPIVRPDLVENPEFPTTIPDVIHLLQRAPSKVQESTEKSRNEPKAEMSSKKDNDDVTKIRERHEKEKTAKGDSRQAEIEKMEAEIRKLSRRRNGEEDSDEERARKKAKSKSYLEEELSKYSKGRGLHSKRDGKKKDEGDVLAALSSFRSKLKGSFTDNEAEEQTANAKEQGAENGDIGRTAEDLGMEVDDDFGFLSHKLYFPKDNTEEVNKAERDYEVIDPRQRNARAKEEEREKRRATKSKGSGHGGRGYRR
ncbi:cyclophilin-like protein [Neolentinus lepideus HHB14362 ss-1]|uniref:Cyclophilin-like protein n=1 Tax=Neolentinus lepideus HHB14362 ss-1 TaxID=1314782 RepID=A0A165SHN4_9AGAM|nr:cyclophilin-like protein [Neolentinus lepideus HHB14362 ss-1]